MATTRKARKLGDHPCPVCGAKMELAQRGKTGIEVCDEHGVWLDKGKLEKISKATTRFEQMRARHAVRRASEDEKVKESWSWLLAELALLSH